MGGRRNVRSLGGTAWLALAVMAAAPPESPVADAAMRGDRDAVLALLREGADVNAAQGDGMTALHWAAERGDAELAEPLVRAGANVEAVTRIGQYTPLHLAARGGSAPVARILLDAGASVAARTDGGGATPLHLAAASGDTATVALLVARGADVDARESAQGQTPLIFAAGRDRAEVVEALLAAGADPDLPADVVDLLHRDSLQTAAARRQRTVLAAFGGGEESPPAPDQVQAAIRAGRRILESGVVPEEPERAETEQERLRRLFREEEPSIVAHGGLTPLLHAVRQGHERTVRVLLDGGADVNEVSAADGTSPLLMATINGQFDLALLLLERGADPNLASTLNGITPLWAAVNAEWQPRTRYPQPQETSFQSATYLDVMAALLEAGADPDARTTKHPWYMVYTGCGNRNCGLVDTEGSTAFWRAAYAVDVAAMRLLAEHGAEPTIPTVAPPERRRRSPDEVLARQSRERLASDTTYAELSDSARIVLLRSVRDDLPDSLHAAFADPRLKEEPGRVRTELLEAVERVDSIREARPDPSGLPPVPPGGPGVYPVNAAAGAGYGEGFAGNAHRHKPDGWLPALRYLIEELGADVNQRDHSGYTPLHHAAARGDNEAVRYLVEKGADVTAVSRKGQTVADMANGPVQRVPPYPETVALLERLGSKNNHKCLSCE